MRMKKLMFTFCSVLLLAMFANGVYYLLYLPENRQWSRYGSGAGNGPAPISDYGEKQEYDYGIRRLEGAVKKEVPVNMIVLGLDGEETRSDVILLFNFDPEQSGLNILSIARDTMVRSDGRYCKINALYSKGGELLLADTVSEITGMPVHYYVTMNFEGFRKIIDTLGGVRFYVPFRMSYDDPAQDLHIHLKKGLQVLDGDKAEQLVRYRKGNVQGQGYTDGDIGRIKMQQDFIKALIDQKLNLKYISKADDIFYLLEKYVKTNITIADIAHYIGSIRKIRSEGIQALTLPGTSKMINGAWYIVLDRKKTRDFADSVFFK